MTRRILAAVVSGLVALGGAAVVAAPASAMVSWEE